MSQLPAMRKSWHRHNYPIEDFMEAENINAIGNQLADLSTRVNELRGYL